MAIGKVIRKGLPFANVVGTGIATADVTPGKTIESVRLKLGGTTFAKSNLSLLKYKANGKVIFEATGAQLDAINQYRGVPADAAFLDIPFADIRMAEKFDKAVSAFDTSTGIGHMSIEASITGATAPTLEMILTEGAAQKSRDGKAAPFAPYFSKVLSYPFSQATGGRLVMQTPFGPQNGAIIKRVHVFHSGTMTGATVKQDGLVIHESVTAENEYAQKRHGRVPQTNVYTIDFVVDGDVNMALDTRDARSLEWLFDFSAAGNGTVLIEYLDTLGNL